MKPFQIRKWPGKVWTRIRWQFRDSSSGDKAGLYLTVIAHLTVIIVLLAVQVNTAIRKSDSFLLDFSAADEREARIKEEAFRESISSRLDKMLGDIPATRPEPETGDRIRNIAVDAGGPLKDDRNTDVSRLRGCHR